MPALAAAEGGRGRWRWRWRWQWQWQWQWRGILLRFNLLMVLAAFAVPFAFLVNHIVPEPYMDEIFHVPQAQSYCRGDYSSWDPNITTFPGLYYLSVAQAVIILPAMRVLGIASSLPEMCTVAYLRSVNVILFLMCGLLLYEVLLELDPEKRTMRAFAKAIILSLYPLHWFFTFLYYTDVGSTAAVMGTYLACLKGSYWISALLAIVAIFFRQTNAVWTLVILCIGVLECLQQRYLPSTPTLEKKQDHVVVTKRKQLCNDENVSSTKEKLRRRRYADSVKGKGISLRYLRSCLTLEDSIDSTFQGNISFLSWRSCTFFYQIKG